MYKNELYSLIKNTCPYKCIDTHFLVVIICTIYFYFYFGCAWKNYKTLRKIIYIFQIPSRRHFWFTGKAELHA